MLILIDIGSTIVKVVRLDAKNNLIKQDFYDRDYNAELYDQILFLIKDCNSKYKNPSFRICSSAKGGLRVGIVCLTERFSGNLTRNLALVAGANTIFVETIDHTKKTMSPRVDVLVVVGGIDCPDAKKMKKQIDKFDTHRYKFQTLIYAGNKYLAKEFKNRYKQAIIVKNPISDNLNLCNEDILHKIRDFYLDDLIEKEGVTKLQKFSEAPIWPTPAIVNLAFEKIAHSKSKLQFTAPYIILDIGGATTDIHFGLELVKTGRSNRLSNYRSINRYVFTELGVFTSRESTVKRLSTNKNLYEFFRMLYGQNASRKYADFLDGNIDEDLLFYACFFLALDSVSQDDDKNSIPLLDIQKIKSIVVTGGASQKVKPERLSRITELFLKDYSKKKIKVILDEKYEIWIEGMKHFPKKNTQKCKMN